MPTTPLYYMQLKKQLQQHGRMEEKQLLARWDTELRDFFALAQNGLISKQQRLEVGLENELVLKLVLKATSIPALAMLLEHNDNLPDAFRPLVHLLMQHPRRYHFGIRLNTDSAHREMYVYDREGDVPEALGGLPPLPGGLVATAYSMDEKQGISCYCTSSDNPVLITELETDLSQVESRLQIKLNGQVESGWYHYRLVGNKWEHAKTGFELQTLTPALRHILLTHAQAPWFHYLVPKQMAAPAVLASSVARSRLGCYFTVL